MLSETNGAEIAMASGDTKQTGIRVSELIEMYQATRGRADEGPLSGLAEIDWSSLEHAHGPADDVPPLLRALVSSNATHREFASLLLHETIWHQGTIYEASLYAVPFLFELLKWSETPDKDAVAFLLASLADGHSPLEETLRDPSYADTWRHILAEEGRDLETEVARGLGWVDRARKAIAKEAHLLYPYLSHSDRTMRSSIARALALCPNRRGEILRRLEDALAAEVDEYAGDEMRSAIRILRQSLFSEEAIARFVE